VFTLIALDTGMAHGPSLVAGIAIPLGTRAERGRKRAPGAARARLEDCGVGGVP
jgi:hypothetical protein